MTETYEFYSQTSTDARSYHGSDWARFFRAMFTSGVEYGNQNALSVSAQDPVDMSVNVATGSAWAYGYYFTQNAITALAIEASDASWNRIDYIVIRNTIASGSAPYVIKGTKAESPAAPALTTDGATYYDVPLATLLVSAGVTDISGNGTTLITDARTYSTMMYAAQDALIIDGNLNAGNQKITELANGTDFQDLVNKSQCDDSANWCPIPPGVVVEFGTASVPTGFLLCDGSSYVRADYPALFAAIGVLHGSADSSHFNVPNMTGRIPVGQDTSDSAFQTVGQTGGATTVTLSEGDLPAHSHSGIKIFTNGVSRYAGTSTDAGSTSGTTGSAGSGGAHNNLGPAIALAYGIRCY